MMCRCNDRQSSCQPPKVFVDVGGVDVFICEIHAVRSADHVDVLQVVPELCVVLAFFGDGLKCLIVVHPKSYVPGLVVGPAVVKLINCCFVEFGGSHVWCGSGGIGDSGALDPVSWAQVTHLYPPVQWPCYRAVTFAPRLSLSSSIRAISHRASYPRGYRLAISRVSERTACDPSWSSIK